MPQIDQLSALSVSPRSSVGSVGGTPRRGGRRGRRDSFLRHEFSSIATSAEIGDMPKSNLPPSSRFDFERRPGSAQVHKRTGYSRSAAGRSRHQFHSAAMHKHHRVTTEKRYSVLSQHYEHIFESPSVVSPQSPIRRLNRSQSMMSMPVRHENARKSAVLVRLAAADLRARSTEDSHGGEIPPAFLQMGNGTEEDSGKKAAAHNGAPRRMSRSQSTPVILQQLADVRKKKLQTSMDEIEAILKKASNWKTRMEEVSQVEQVHVKKGKKPAAQRRRLSKSKSATGINRLRAAVQVSMVPGRPAVAWQKKPTSVTEAYEIASHSCHARQRVKGKLSFFRDNPQSATELRQRVGGVEKERRKLRRGRSQIGFVALNKKRAFEQRSTSKKRLADAAKASGAVTKPRNISKNKRKCGWKRRPPSSWILANPRALVPCQRSCKPSSRRRGRSDLRKCRSFGFP